MVPPTILGFLLPLWGTWKLLLHISASDWWLSPLETALHVVWLNGKQSLRNNLLNCSSEISSWKLVVFETVQGRSWNKGTDFMENVFSHIALQEDNTEIVTGAWTIPSRPLPTFLLRLVDLAQTPPPIMNLFRVKSTLDVPRHTRQMFSFWKQKVDPCYLFQ